MITSRKNSQLKTIRRLRRSKDDRALLEGPHLISEALNAGHDLSCVLATPEFLDSDPGRRLAPRLEGLLRDVDSRLLAEVTDSDSPRGIVAVARLLRPTAAELPRVEGGTYVYAEGLQDPGNLGAVVRAAEASGAAAVCLSPESAHPNHPRALRASAGSLLRLPVATCSTEALADRLTPLVPTWAALVPRGGQSLFEAPLAGCVVLVLGAEGSGLTPELQRRANLELTIPLAPPVESLNAAVAAAVALFELRRRRSG
jgi:RNA methyltransferase, TrmH family